MGTHSDPRPTRQSPPAGPLQGSQASKSEAGMPRTVTLVDGRQLSLVSDAAPDEKIAAIAGRQRGGMARRQLLLAGVDRHAIDRRSKSGRLALVHPGIYGMPGTSELPLAPETAAVLACGDGAALSHHSAMTLWGLRPGVARPVHVTIPGGRG